jgi:hypothetical protein
VTTVPPVPTVPTEPWYRQFWPWFLMALPASVVVAGLSTWWIAARHADDLVADEYYKNGLAINRELGKTARSELLGLTADLTIEGQLVSVRLAGNSTPGALRLYFSHPLEADRDLDIALARTAPGRYEGELPFPLHYRWLWRLEPIQGQPDELWRIDGEVTLSPSG